MLSLIIGGAGSGKSAFAEALVQKQKCPIIYLATMAVTDAESQARVERHRQMRAGKGFETRECSLNLKQLQIPEGASILLEDLPNLLANERYSPEGGGTEAVRQGIAFLEAHSAGLTIVSGDLFSGGSAYDEESLFYLRELAALHRELAARAELVAEIVCGVPNVLKGVLP